MITDYRLFEYLSISIISDPSVDTDDSVVLAVVDAYRNVNKADTFNIVTSPQQLQLQQQQSTTRVSDGGNFEKGPKLLIAEEEKILIEEFVNGQVVLEERLVSRK